MSHRIHAAGFAAALLLASSAAFAKLPPPTPEQAAAKEAAAAKKTGDAEKAKGELAASEERTIKNWQANMRKEGKPIPKPVPTSATSTPPKGGEKKPQSNTQKSGKKS